MIIKRLKLIPILISSIILLTACGGGGGSISAPSSGITAVPVNTKASFPVGFIPTAFGINAYSIFLIPFAISMYLPNGLQNVALQSSQTTPPFWLINTGFPGISNNVPVFTSIDNLGRIVIIKSSESSALLITLGTKNTNSINASVLNADSFFLTPADLNPRFRVIGNGSTPSAIGVFYSSESNQGLTFANFVPVGQSSTIIGSSPNFALCKQTVQGSGESISAMTTYNNSQGNQFFTGVGTSLGALCIYDFGRNVWISLTGNAVNGGYQIGGDVSTLQFLNFNNSLYLYWLSSSPLPQIWRSILNSNNQPTAVINLFDPSKFSNIPPITLSPPSLFIDPYNNVYIGNIGSSIPGINLPSIVYVLPAGSTTWQTVPLGKNESGLITVISLAVDGKTPVVGATHLNTINPLLSTVNTYYLQGINN